MANVQDFLRTKEQLTVTKDIKVSPELPEFKIKALTGTELEEIQRAATITVLTKGGSKQPQTDNNKLQDELIAKAVVFPDLEGEEIQKHYGTIGDAAGTARAMLFAGEMLTLQSAIQELSGFSADEEIEDVKN